MFELKLPDLGEGIREGEILKWHVAVGDAVVEDASLVDVETDKATVTIPSPRSGRVVSQNGKAGDIVAVGSVMVVIDDGSSSIVGEVQKISSKEIPPPTGESAPAESAAHIKKRQPIAAAPATRKLARELHVDLTQVQPTGRGDRVTADDVRQFAKHSAGTGKESQPSEKTHFAASAEVTEKHSESTASVPASSGIPFLDIEPLPDFAQWGPVETEPLRSIRRRVARKMVTSMILVPHVAHMDEADVTLLEEFRHQEQKRRQDQPGGHLTLLPFVIKAVTAGLKAAPAFNASLDPFKETIIYKKYYNLGIAVDTGRGLVVPVIRNTDRKSIIEISCEVEDLAKRAREGKSGLEDFRGGTFTITNVGPIGGTALIPAINYPEVAILGMGRAQEKPVVRQGEIVIRKILPLTLAFDHRIADGADAARFVAELVRCLSDPNLLLLET